MPKAESIETPLQAIIRDPKMNVKALRRKGWVPGVVYGADGHSTLIALPAGQFLKIYHRAGTTHPFPVVINGHPPIQVLVKQYDVEPTSGILRHVDLYRITGAERVNVDVPLKFVGVAPAVSQGGILVTEHETVTLRCPADSIPEYIEVDLSPLESIGDTVTVGDLRLPEGVIAVDDAETVLVHISTPVRAVEEEAEEEAEEAS